jgi:hypothetical protein
VEFFDVKPGGAYSDHWALKSQIILDPIKFVVVGSINGSERSTVENFALRLEFS